MKTKLTGAVVSGMTVVVLILMLVGSRVLVSAHPLQDSRTDFIAYVASSAQSEMRDSGIPASFSIGQSAHETGFKCFPYYNNFHGVKCPGPPPPARCENNWRVYNNPEEAFLDHGHWLTQNTRYANAFNYVDDPAQFAREVANAGYSEGDPTHYANVVIGYINQYNLTQYDNQNIPFVGVFYTNPDLSGQPVWVNQTQDLNFDWDGGSPNWRISADNFSIRWKARRQFSAGRYRFHTVTDDGVRLWIDGNLIINQWHDQPPTEWTGDIDLGDGFHWIRMEYYERGGGAVARLWWERIGSGPGTCSTGQYRAEYYNNRSLIGSPTFTRCEGSINYDWGSGGPGNGVGNDNFSVRWTGRHNFSGGNYTFIARADDGIRVWVDGSLIINAWRDQPPTEYRTNRSLSAGEHEVKVEFYENGGGAVAQVRWEQASVTCPNQYRAEYYNNRYLSGNPTFVRCENWPINHDWGSGGPGDGVGNDNFSVRWTGRAHISSGDYTFIARADDGIRVWIGGDLIIDAWRDQSPTEYRVTRYVSSGDYDIRVEYYENGGGAVAQFRWEQAYEIVAKHSSRCLDVEGARQDNGTNVQQWACGGGSNQRWWLASVGGGYYKIVAVHSGKCLDVAGSSQDNGANVIQWDCHGGDNQLWRLDQIGDAYRIVAVHSGKCLDVAGGSQSNGANVIQWDCHGGDNQLWRLD